MEHADHVALITDGISRQGGTWADFGAGWGAFTLALADLIGTQGTIYAIDKDGRALTELEKALQSRFPGTELHTLNADFARPIELPLLDGAIMANSLHFHREKHPILRQVYQYLKPGAILVVVEYNADRGNPWVPFPFSYSTWEDMAASAGFINTRLLSRRPSRNLSEIYSAASERPPFDTTTALTPHI